MTPIRAPRRDFWLTLGENLRIALRALRANKMRTILTIIGNVVAVMSVIAVVSIIDGMNTYVSEKILDQGLRVIYIDKYGLITDEDEWRLAQRRRDLTTFESGALEDRMRLARRGSKSCRPTRTRSGRRPSSASAWPRRPRCGRW